MIGPSKNWKGKMAENKIELENIEVPMKRAGSAEEPDAKRPKQESDTKRPIIHRAS